MSLVVSGTCDCIKGKNNFMFGGRVSSLLNISTFNIKVHVEIICLYYFYEIKKNFLKIVLF